MLRHIPTASHYKVEEMTRRTLLAMPALAAAQTSIERLLAPPSGRVDAVVDSDTYNEIDDQFAVAYALCSPASMSIEAVYAAPFHNERSSSAGDRDAR